MRESILSEGFMNSNSKILSAIAIVLALVIFGSEILERRANSSETLLNPSNPQINIAPEEKPVPDAEEMLPDEGTPEETPEVQPEPINPQPKRRFIIPRSSPRGIGGGCSPGGCPSGGEMYYESSSYYGSPVYSYGYCR
jgi:hypothetical protein